LRSDQTRLLLAGLAVFVGEILRHGGRRGGGDQGKREEELFHFASLLRLLAVKPEPFGPKGMKPI
jgi:hypothetical protein